ncbi:MAG: epoxyqueuosine reductase, partial [Deltaproteobacteria bacterium]|nr:epoxyqueuosine reductase [Deltaproteobacteria bacterium]
MEKAQQLSELVKNIARGSEAVAVGIATTETLEGGPPSTDLTY